MTRLNDSKLQLLVREAPQRVVLTAAWLQDHGISSKLAWWYVKSGWLERVADGAYKKQGDSVKWMGAVSALQYQLDLPLYVGGKSALQLLGRAHYVPVAGLKKVILYKAKRFTIPSWFKNTDWQVDLAVRTVSLFDEDKIKIQTIVEREVEKVLLKISTPERAIIEFLYHVPKYNTFNEASLLMENLAQLRPNVMQELLRNCYSIKTKRLVLYLAEKYDHVWLKGLDVNCLQLGGGKIRIGEGGKYINKYKISIPKTEKDDYEF